MSESQPLAIIPARVGSKGVPNKNFRLLPDGHSLTWRAVECAKASGCGVVVSTDGVTQTGGRRMEMMATREAIDAVAFARPAALAQDDTPMIDVVRHVLEHIPGPPDQTIVLLQPTSPFRTVQHVQTALELLVEPWTSVVSVVEVPEVYRPDLVCEIDDDAWAGDLQPWGARLEYGPWWDAVARRQDARPAYRRDGTVYVFRRDNVSWNHTIYGTRTRPYILPASESFTIDTLEDWDEAERRVYAEVRDRDNVYERKDYGGTFTIGPDGRIR